MRSAPLVPLVLLGFLVVPLGAQGPTVGAGAAEESASSLVDPIRVSHDSGLQQGGAGSDLQGSGANYGVQFSTAGVRFMPALGRAVYDTQHLTLAPIAVRRGGTKVVEMPSQVPPERSERTAVFAHAPGVTERFDVQPDGVELSWVFERQPAGEGDLVVRYAIDTNLPAPVATNGGFAFELPGIGGVQIGGVTGVDARGTRVAGTLRCADGVLEMSLPAAFVTAATYPIVLDPTIGSLITLANSLNPEDEPDVAFDRTSGFYLVVWRRTYSVTQTQILGQLVVGSTGALYGPGYVLFSAGVSSRPRVANLGNRNRFGVVWSQTFNGTHSVEFNTVDVTATQVGHSLTVASSTSGDYDYADVGCETEAPIGASRAFVVAYEDNVLGAIRTRRIWFNGFDSLLSSAAASVYTNSGGVLGSSYSQPQISRSAGSDGKLFLVARRSILLQTGSIVGVVVPTDGSAIGPFTIVYSSPAFTPSAPDVDGFAGRWVVAWQRSVAAGTAQPLGVRPVSFDAASAQLSLGTDQTVSGGLTDATAPSVGYTPGRTWVGYRAVYTPTTFATLEVESIDSGTCVTSLDLLPPEPAIYSDSRIVVTTMASSGQTSAEDGLAVWGSVGDLYAQRVRNHTNAGNVVNLGGSCGGGGLQSFSHFPAIGSSGLVCSLNGLFPTALLTIFNFSPPTATIPCGTCVWSPWAVTLTPPIVNGYASVEFAIPDLLSLVGAQFETQWTTIDLTQIPCPVFPGFALSPRARLTIGN